VFFYLTRSRSAKVFARVGQAARQLVLVGVLVLPLPHYQHFLVENVYRSISTQHQAADSHLHHNNIDIVVGTAQTLNQVYVG